jgi:hypothetical protein
MARWKNRGHAYAPYFLLGRVWGLPEKQMESAWARNDLKFLLEAAQKSQ